MPVKPTLGSASCPAVQAKSMPSMLAAPPASPLEAKLQSMMLSGLSGFTSQAERVGGALGRRVASPWFVPVALGSAWSSQCALLKGDLAALRPLLQVTAVKQPSPPTGRPSPATGGMSGGGMAAMKVWASTFSREASGHH